MFSTNSTFASSNNKYFVEVFWVKILVKLNSLCIKQFSETKVDILLILIIIIHPVKFTNYIDNPCLLPGTALYSLSHPLRKISHHKTKADYLTSPIIDNSIIYYLKSVQIRSYFWSVFSRIQTEYGVIFSQNAGKYGPEITPYLDTFHAVLNILLKSKLSLWNINLFDHLWDKCFAVLSFA